MVSLIIPVYTANKDLVKMTDKCLTSLFLTTPPDTEVIIVDDGSPIPYDPDLGRLIRLSENGGYSKATNAGMKACKGDVIIVGNNDLVFTEGWFSELTGVLKWFDIATCWTSDQDVKLEEGVEEDAKFGSLFAMKREVYETLGGFDEQFRGYFADLDYRQRALNEGFKIGKNLSLVVDHEAKATYGVTDPDDQEYLKAMKLYEIKHGFVE